MQAERNRKILARFGIGKAKVNRSYKMLVIHHGSEYFAISSPPPNWHSFAGAMPVCMTCNQTVQMEWSIALSATNDAAKMSSELGHAKAGHRVRSLPRS